MWSRIVEDRVLRPVKCRFFLTQPLTSSGLQCLAAPPHGADSCSAQSPDLGVSLIEKHPTDTSIGLDQVSGRPWPRPADSQEEPSQWLFLSEALPPVALVAHSGPDRQTPFIPAPALRLTLPRCQHLPAGSQSVRPAGHCGRWTRPECSLSPCPRTEGHGILPENNRSSRCSS